MARKVLVRLVDDLDGLPSEDVATVTFSLDRVSYQIDLNESNASKLRDGLAEFVAAARRTGGRIKRGSGAAVRVAGQANDGPAIREWAREQGHQLAERGRIPSHIVDAFRAASGKGRAKVAKIAEAAPAAKPARAPRKVAAKTAAASRTAAAASTTATATAPRTRAAGTKAASAKPAAKATTAKATAAKPAAKATKTTKATEQTAKATTAKSSTTGKAAKTPRSTASTAAAKGGQRAPRKAPASKSR